MTNLRTSPTGPFLEGAIDGQVLVWNQAARQWEPGFASGGGITVYPLQSQLNWDTNVLSNVLELVPAGEPSGLYLIGWAITTAAVTPTFGIQGNLSFDAPDVDPSAAPQILIDQGMGTSSLQPVSSGNPLSRIGLIRNAGTSPVVLQFGDAAGEVVNLYAIAVRLTP